jgi:sigma-B regulation protein RsbU (phosphoserine phosphatase)
LNFVGDLQLAFDDFFIIDDDHLCFAVGDVSRKGVPASLFMAVTKTLFRATSGNGGTPVAITSPVCS